MAACLVVLIADMQLLQRKYALNFVVLVLCLWLGCLFAEVSGSDYLPILIGSVAISAVALLVFRMLKHAEFEPARDVEPKHLLGIKIAGLGALVVLVGVTVAVYLSLEAGVRVGFAGWLIGVAGGVVHLYYWCHTWLRRD